ncbi:MAG: hypothetical protein ACSLFP_10615 [Acidimicrobiales bacterium]
MSRRRGRVPVGPGLAVVAVVLTCTFAPPAPATAVPGSACEGFGAVAVAGAVGDQALVEVSGLAASRAHAGVLWAHNDSGAEAVLHALGPDGAALGAYAVPGATAVDWEDLAVGPGPEAGAPVLFVGDVGDNEAQRPVVAIHRVAEPAAAPDGTGGTLELVDTTEVSYPDGPADVEALVVDPDTGDVLLLTKDLLGASRVLLVPADRLGADEPVTATDVGGFQVPIDLALGGGLPGTMVTGADAAPGGEQVLVRTYRAVLAFERPAGQPLSAAFAAVPCRAPQADEPQGEAVAFTATGDAYLTIGEGREVPVHRVDLDRAVAPTSSSTLAPSSTEAGAPLPTAAEGAGRSPSDDESVGPRLAGLLAGGVVVVVLVVVLRRRRAG